MAPYRADMLWGSTQVRILSSYDLLINNASEITVKYCAFQCNRALVNCFLEPVHLNAQSPLSGLRIPNILPIVKLWHESLHFLGFSSHQFQYVVQVRLQTLLKRFKCTGQSFPRELTPLLESYSSFRNSWKWPHHGRQDGQGNGKKLTLFLSI